MAAGKQFIGKLTDSTGGVVSVTDTVVDVGAAYAEATLAAQLATIVAKLNDVIDVVQRNPEA